MSTHMGQQHVRLTLCWLLHFMSQLDNGATQTHRFQLIHSCTLSLPTCFFSLQSGHACPSLLVFPNWFPQAMKSITLSLLFKILTSLKLIFSHIVNMLFNHNKIPGNKTFRTTDKDSRFISKDMIITKAAEGKNNKDKQKAECFS